MCTPLFFFFLVCAVRATKRNRRTKQIAVRERDKKKNEVFSPNFWWEKLRNLAACVKERDYLLAKDTKRINLGNQFVCVFFFLEEDLEHHKKIKSIIIE